MLAWKFFATGAVAPFSGVRWPAGTDWVEGAVSACAIAHLPYWIDDELWLVELEGDVVERPRQLLAHRGRLIRRCDEWAAARRDFSAACVERLQGLVRASPDPILADYLADAVRRAPYPGLCGYILANAAAAAGGIAGCDEERALQAAWLDRRLGLREALAG